MSKPLVLIIDDEEGIRESLSDILSDEGYRTALAESAEEGLRLLEDEETPDLVFLDVWLPGMDGIEALGKIKALKPDLPVILISGHGNIEIAVKATKLGAHDFIEKPLSLERVVLAAKHAMALRSLERENITLKETLSRGMKLIGESAPMRAIRQQIELAVRGSSRVLITGESGTGKEIVARMLHSLSPRATGPFIEVNCAAIPEELIESELFGHEKGSFTGAFEKKKGKFELADGGTLFLDEIGDMSFQTQAKLLRVLETQEFQRVGGSKNIKVDVRVLSATNKDLTDLIRKGRFREDLYYRLNVLEIHLPPLRERKEDIPALVEHFLDLIATEYGQARKKVADGLIAALKVQEWPGNIRELKNAIERLTIMTRTELLSPDGLRAGGPVMTSEDQGLFEIRTLKDARDAFEREFIQRRLAENGWNVTKTAEALDIERSNLHRKIKGYDIRLPGGQNTA